MEGNCVNLKSKTLYKLLILMLKYIPMLIALCYLLNTLASVFGLTCDTFSHIAGMSLLTWIFLYLAAVVFRFCIYHRMFLWYIFTDDIINIIDYHIGIPVDDFHILGIHFIIAGIFLFIILYLHQKKR